MRTAVLACGALALHVKAIAARDGLALDVHPLPPELHNRPERIAPAVEALAERLAGRYDRILIGYADCGSRGAVDELAARLGAERLPGDTATTCSRAPRRSRSCGTRSRARSS